MQCPRCSHKTIIEDARSVDGDKVFWSIFRCDLCNYSWRSSEEAMPQMFAQKPRAFKVTTDQLASLRIALPSPAFHQK